MKRIAFISIITALLFSSCKKDTSIPNQPDTPVTVTDYFPLQIGSYWLYETYRADSSLQFVDDNITDSVWIDRDSVLNGNTYKIFRSSRWPIQLFRDSADYIVNELGQKLFTIKNTSDYLVNQYQPMTDSAFYNTAVVKQSDSLCVVPAGGFQAKYVVGTVTARKPSPTSMTKRNYYFAFAKHVGMVFRRILYAADAIYLEERLVRHYVNIGQMY